FQMMVNQNCYTNYMGQFTFRYTLEVMKRMQADAPESFAKVVAKVAYDEAEGKDWQEKADAMYIPYDEERQLFEQHEGYFELPHIDVDAIPIADFPLYHHWSYDRIYRNDMIKQPDVLMFLLMFNSSFSEEVIRKNYDFYEPRCIHESSLSPSVHSILAAQLNKPEEAFDFFKFATRMDLDNYNRNSGEGLHTTSIAAAWMNIVYGFGGLRSDAEVLSLAPSIPDAWDSYKFHIVYGEEVICVEVQKDKVCLKTLGDTDITLCIYGKETVINGTEQEFAIL
uniref:glycosyl hydrolase family 65 protein n=1 Tax=Acetatifactor sp. TaxID=1872090 RepID=UPI004055B0B4